MKFESKVVEINAIQFTGNNLLEVQEFVGVLDDGNTFGFRRSKDQRKEWPADEVIAKVYDFLHDTWVGVRLNDWIIRGSKGEFYPCDPEVFSSKYQPSLSERTKNLPHETNALEWASVWMEYMARKPHIAFDEGTMLCWFANAIQAGHDEARRHYDPETRKQLKEFGLLSDDELEDEAYEENERRGSGDCLHVSVDEDSDADEQTCEVCGTKFVRQKPENGDLTPVGGSRGDSVIFAHDEASDRLLAVLKDEEAKAKQEASGGLTESIKKDTGIDG